MNSPVPLLSLVVSTIGRPQALRKLLDSLNACDDAEKIELILVDQSQDLACTALLTEQPNRFPVYSTTSARGLSVGRNVGLQLAQGRVVAFPDDDSWYRPQTISAVLARFRSDPQLKALSGCQLTGDGRSSMLRWASQALPVTLRNAHRTTISSTLFIDRELVERVGGFAESIGAGSSGWYGAGEDTDLVLRLLELTDAFQYDPLIVVHHDEPRDHPSPSFVDKMFRYGCGQGYVWRTHDYSNAKVALLLIRKCGAGAVHAAQGKWSLSNSDVAFVRGCVAGLRARAPRAPSALDAAHLKRNFAPRLVMAGCGMATTFVLTLLAVRLLDARSATAFAAIVAALMIGPMLGRLGLGTRAMLLIAGETGAQRAEVASDHLFATAVFATLTAPAIAFVATTSLSHVPGRTLYIALTAMLLILESIRLTMSDIFAGLGLFGWSVFTTHHVRSVLTLIGIGAAAVWGGFTLMTVLVVGLVVGLLTVTVGLHRLVGAVTLGRPPTPRALVTATRAGVVLLLIDLASFLVGRGDVWLAAASFDPAAALRYSTASLVAFQITVPMGLANVALSPIAVRMWKDHAWDQLRDKLDSVAAISVALTTAATLIFWVAGPFVVGLVYGSELRSAWLPLAILATGTIVFSAWGGSSVLLIVSGHGREAALTGLVVLTVIIPLAALTAQLAGPTALALASSAATCCLVGSQKWCAKRYVGFSPSPLRRLGLGHSRHEPPRRLLDNTASR